MIRKPRSTCALPTCRSPRTTSHVAPPLRMAASAAILLGVLAGCAAPEVPPANTTMPESLRTPPQEVLEDAFTAVGETIYSCRREAGRLSWVGKGSEATLVDGARRNVGTLVPGPRFLAYDGSSVAGRVAAEEIVATDSLPWQLIIARRTSGSGAEKGKGRFAKVTSVQQVHTRGGLPPQTGCTQQGISLLVPFSATYLIYRPATAQLPAKSAPEGTTTPVPTAAPVATPLSSATPARTATHAAAATPAAAPLSTATPLSNAAPLSATAPTPSAASMAAPPSSGAPAPTPAAAPTPAPVLTVASVSEISGLGLPTFFDYIRP